ncbi:MAG: DNA repair protein RadA, partial [Zoogloea sp.]|nr:DNA repair protein RadA [Zoogloea sp.]
MAKVKTEHVCSECGGKSPRWQGQCPHCKAWNTLVESLIEAETPLAKRFSALAGDSGRLQTLAEIRPQESP